MLAAMPGQIPLPVTVDVEPPHDATAFNGRLPDPGVDRLSSPRDIPRQTHIHRKQARRRAFLAVFHPGSPPFARSLAWGTSSAISETRVAVGVIVLSISVANGLPPRISDSVSQVARSLRAASTTWSAEIPAARMSSVGVPDPGRPRPRDD